MIKIKNVTSLVLILFSVTCQADPPATLSEGSQDDLNARLHSVELSLEHLEAELEILKTQNTMVIQATQLSFLNSTYFRANLALVLPRPESFPSGSDTGLGFGIGGGRYLGRHHVFDFSLSWDLYIAAAVRYRYEIHTTRSGLTIGPVLGYKFRLLDVDPFDRFITNPDELRPSFWLAGLFLGMPMSAGAMMSVEFSYHFNGQNLIFLNAGISFFL